MKKENLINRIINAGIKNTKYRVYMIELLSKTDELLSAQEIHKRLINKNIKINLSTVYRTIDVLVENNILNKVSIDNEKQALYEYNREEHHHFLICQGCGKITPIYFCPMEEYETKIEKETNFNITGHNIVFYGYCEDCQKEKIQ